MTAVTPRHRRPLSEAEIAQRRAAASKPRGTKGKPLSEAQLAENRRKAQLAMGHHTGPKTEAGKAITSRNAWKHGRYSEAHKLQRDLVGTSIAGSFGKPCLTGCPHHPDNPRRTDAPCTLVTSGQTKAGGDCLDRRVYVEAFDAILAAMHAGEMDGLNGVLAANMAANMQIVQQLREVIANKGFSSETPLTTKDGDIIIDPRTGNPAVAKIHQNPEVFMLIRMMEAMGLNLPEMMATPRAREKVKDDNDRTDTMSAMLGAVMSRFGTGPAPRAPRPALEADDADA